MSGALSALRHIPVRGAQTHDADDHIHERALMIRAYRMQLLASNIANADTPGYKARDVDVAQALREKIATVAEIPVGYVVPRQPSLDGNTVEMDAERSKFSENAIMYQFSAERAIGHYRHMMELFRDLKD
ncbi:MAG: flagellar basal body rod protein FlgB [Betaproteobacteria bacterium]|nr:flagellar basal body rod protein FlgB [Betaproteobacteria bacterium]